jgi:hypothetical protein
VAGWWFSPSTLVSSTNKPDLHNTNEREDRKKTNTRYAIVMPKLIYTASTANPFVYIYLNSFLLSSFSSAVG